MRLFVPKEIAPGERRVALVPDTVGKLARLGLEVSVETGAGAAAYYSDAEYEQAGAIVLPNAIEGITGAEVVASVRPLDPAYAEVLEPGAVAVSFLQPGADADTVAAVAERGATALSFDLLPRISRAQSMDALTSQALVTGYRAALVAAALAPKFFPLFMTAAGTIPPAKVLVLGAGVAGLQAIATAKRLGAIVSAYDVRAASADEVKSMGATFITLELEALEAGGGYAREMTEDRAAKQRELLTPYVAESDAVITTAAVPGRRAPLLVTAEMVDTMSPGAVVVDLAAETGGNVEGVEAGVTQDRNGVRVWGAKDAASAMPVHASKLFAMNVVALLGLVANDGELVLDIEDEIIDGCAVVL
ncbi:MAG: NAD(P) transhydrogenase subunit alpha, partial [Actinobacteria bacterium]|nr:NAD(P) transhydrogenase subunit alpha [Actinomycetota bacterium]